MEVLKRKRNRGPNFSNDEKVLLLSLVDKYKNILESKKTDGATWRDKESAWERVLREFNASNPSTTKRTMDSLKICYENIKRSTRKKAANSKVEINKTGGGSTCCSSVDPVFDLTLSILNKKTVFGITNKFDGDGQHNVNENSLEDYYNTEELQQDVENTEERDPSHLTNEQGQISHNSGQELEESDESEEQVDWGNFKPEFLQAPLNKKLQNVRRISPENIAASSSTSGKKIRTRKWTKRRRPIINSSTNVARQYEDVAAIKIEVFRQQLSLMKKEEEHKQKQWQHEELIRETEIKRNEEKWELEKKVLILDVRIKEAQLMQLNKLNRM